MTQRVVDIALLDICKLTSTKNYTFMPIAIRMSDTALNACCLSKEHSQTDQIWGLAIVTSISFIRVHSISLMKAYGKNRGRAYSNFSMHKTSIVLATHSFVMVC